MFESSRFSLAFLCRFCFRFFCFSSFPFCPRTLRVLLCLFPPSFHPPPASSSLSNLVLCFVSAELPRLFSLSELCSTAEGHEPSQVKAARDHVKVRRLSWGRFRFARCLHLPSLCATVLRPVLCYGNNVCFLLCGKAYFSRKLRIDYVFGVVCGLVFFKQCLKSSLETVHETPCL